MNRRTMSAAGMIALAGLMSSLAQIPREVTSTSSSLGTCPDGHKALRDVPIRYGLNYISSKGHEKDVEDLKYVCGADGCNDDSPTSMVICAQCRFRYLGEGMWYKSGTNYSAFGIPFAGVMTNFLAVFKASNPIHYTQQVRSNEVVMENVQFGFEGDAKQLTAQVVAFMDAHKIAKRASGNGFEIFLGIDPSQMVHQVWLLPDRGQRLLTYTMCPEERPALLEGKGQSSDKPRSPTKAN